MGDKQVLVRAPDACFKIARRSLFHRSWPHATARLLLVSAVGITATVDASEAAEDLLARYTSSARVASSMATLLQLSRRRSRGPLRSVDGRRRMDARLVEPRAALRLWRRVVRGPADAPADERLAPQLWFSRLSAPVSDFRFSCATRRCEASTTARSPSTWSSTRTRGTTGSRRRGLASGQTHDGACAHTDFFYSSADHAPSDSQVL